MTDTTMQFKKIIEKYGNVSTDFINQNTVKAIQKIRDAKNLPLATWLQFLQSNKNNPIVDCALLAYEKVPSEIKIQAIQDAAKYKNASQEIFIPILMSDRQELLGYMTRGVSEELVKHIPMKDLKNAILDYEYNHPYTTWLPFSGTHVDEIIAEGIVNGKLLTSSQKTQQDYYKVLEKFYDENVLKDIVGDITECDECIRNSIINNKHITEKFREQIYEAGVDISQITHILEPKIMKKIYASVVESATPSNPDEKNASDAKKTLSYWTKNNYLSESCQLDLMLRVENDEVLVDKSAMIKMIEQTNSEAVLKKAAESNILYFRIGFLKNKNADISMAKNVLQKMFNRIEKTKMFVSTTGEKEMMFSACKTFKLPEDMYYKMINCFYPETDIILGTIISSPTTPSSVLEKLSKDNQVNKELQGIAYIMSKLPECEYGKSKIKVIDCKIKISNSLIDIVNKKIHNFWPFIPTDTTKEYLPSFKIKENLELRGFLDKILNGDNEQAKQDVKIYLETLNTRDKIEKIKYRIEEKSKPLNDLTNEELETVKMDTIESVFLKEKDIGLNGLMTKHKTYDTIYEKYQLYDDLFENLDEFNKIEKIENERGLNKDQEIEIGR